MKPPDWQVSRMTHVNSPYCAGSGLPGVGKVGTCPRCLMPVSVKHGVFADHWWSRNAQVPRYSRRK